MRITMLLLVVASLGVTVGCDKSHKAAMDPVPPPAADYRNDQAPLYGDNASAAGGIEPTPVVMDDTITVIDSAPAAGGGTYTIRKGDTLWSIAKNQLGDGKRWQEIADANPGVNPKRLLVGQMLVIP